jgi:hypothetical protein
MTAADSSIADDAGADVVAVRHRRFDLAEMSLGRANLQNCRLSSGSSTEQV